MHVTIPLTSLIVLDLLASPLFNSYPISCVIECDMYRMTLSSIQIFWPYFLSDIPKLEYCEIFPSLQLFLNYQEHHVDKSELLQMYYI